MFLEASYYCEPSAKEMIPRERFVRYYRDLHARYHLSLDEKTFSSGSPYKFSDLGYNVFDPCAKDNNLKHIDLMVGAYWAHEYDPDFASCGPHFSYKYGFDCNMFDVLDQGSLCTFTAIHLISRYFENNSATKALCFAFDQTVIPRSSIDSIPVPTKTAAGLVVLNKDGKRDTQCRIETVELWPEYVLCEGNLNMIGLLLEMLRKYGLAIEQCSILCKRSSIVYKAFNFYKNRYKELNSHLDIQFLPIEDTCVEPLNVLNQLNNRIIKTRPFVALIDDDVESLAVAVMIVSVPELVEVNL